VILLDTHVILWLGFIAGDMSKHASLAVQHAEEAGTQFAASVASVYEIAYGLQRGRIAHTMPQDAFLSRVREKVRILPITDEIAITAGQIPAPFHGNPMDRIITATAIVENCTLITADERIRRAGICKTIW
jgi:PIN domain nuclease of toxin-antitoxin system